MTRYASTAARRFQQAAQRVREARGGRPVATLQDGIFTFTYPDGTVTYGGADSHDGRQLATPDLSKAQGMCTTCCRPAPMDTLCCGKLV